MHVSVQKSTSTTRPPSAARSSGSEFSQAVAPPSEGMCTSWEIVISIFDSVALAAEQVEQQQEDVEDVEEDARCDDDGAVGVRPPQPIEVEDRVGAEDPEPGDGVDDVGVGDRDEDRDDPERDQSEQRPEQRPA